MDGSDFGNNGTVQIGSGNDAAIQSWANDRIELQLPALPIGRYPLLIMVADGFADTR